jgi:D-arabinose 1-dehydrogenase-like Zn-dependent alcohol dehydrogenase
MQSFQVEHFGRPLVRVLRETAPQPQGSEVVLRVTACGVCHTDVHLHDGYFDLGAGNKLDMQRSMNLPRTLGHEIAGTVVAVGPDAAGQVAPGDARVAFPWIGCGSCAMCAADAEHLCLDARELGVQRDGGYATHVVVPHPRYLLDFAPLSPAQACTYGCAVLTAYSALRKAAPLQPSGDTLLMLGAGGVGLSGIRLARRLYPGVRIVVAEIDAAKAEVALAAGAAEVIDPRDAAAGKALFKASGGGVAVAIDFVGSEATFSFGLAALRKGGKLVCVGLFGGSAPVLPVMLAMKAVTIAGSFVGSLAEMRELLALVRDDPLPEMPLDERPLSGAEEALADLRAGRVRGRAVLRP